MASIDVKAVLLQALAPGPAYIGDLWKTIEEMTNGAIKISRTSMYDALRGMAAKGLVESYPVKSDAAGPPRKCFKLTRSGKRAADADRAIASGVFGLPRR